MNVSSHIVSASASLLRQQESRNSQAKLSTQLWQWYVAVTIAQLCPCDLNVIERPSFRSWNHDISFQRYIFLFNVSQNSDMDVLGCSRVVLRGQMHVVISFTTHMELFTRSRSHLFSHVDDAVFSLRRLRTVVLRVREAQSTI